MPVETQPDRAGALSQMEASADEALDLLEGPAVLEQPPEALLRGVRASLRSARAFLLATDADTPLSFEQLGVAEAVLRANLAVFPYFHRVELTARAGEAIEDPDLTTETLGALRRDSLAASIAVQQGLSQAYRAHLARAQEG